MISAENDNGILEHITEVINRSNQPKSSHIIKWKIGKN